MAEALWLGLFIPLVGFIGIMLSANRISRQLAGWVACSTVFISFICFSTLLVAYFSDHIHDQTVTLFHWIPIKGINADFALHVDSLSLLMTLIITGVGFLIHVYSIGYMDHDENFARYFACLNFFIFAMLLLVLAAHLALLFVGWEGVGLASYLLIGFWYNRPAAAHAATKAFVVNRIGDAGLLIGLLMTFYYFGTSNIETVNTQAAQIFAVGAPVVTLLTLMYFIGAIGKSAQLPLHVWLPDAMEGPTPVSALIHAATMVTAGVYLVVRMHPVFELAPVTMEIVGLIGGLTALFAAFCAVGQNDLKRVLAYSTVSQLGLMFLACGAGAFYAAMFHLTTHAFVKGLLFLSAGNVVHMMHGNTLMEKMGGLMQRLPITNVFFVIGALALAGIPPLSIFFSKDLILEQEFDTRHYTLFWIGLLASTLTAFYLMRAYFLSFTGKPRLDASAFAEIKEAPPIMIGPVSVLAFLAIVGGLIGFAFHGSSALERFLATSDVMLANDQFSTGFHFSIAVILSLLGAIIGVGLAWLLYTRYTDRLGNTWALLAKSFYIDEIYWKGIAVPFRSLGNFIANITEPIFEKSLQSVAYVSQGAAAMLQRMQSGQIRSYVAWMAAGAALLIGYFIF